MKLGSAIPEALFNFLLIWLSPLLSPENPQKAWVILVLRCHAELKLGTRKERVEGTGKRLSMASKSSMAVSLRHCPCVSVCCVPAPREGPGEGTQAGMSEKLGSSCRSDSLLALSLAYFPSSLGFSLLWSIVKSSV